jgi:hypothetical protein
MMRVCISERNELATVAISSSLCTDAPATEAAEVATGTGAGATVSSATTARCLLAGAGSFSCTAVGFDDAAATTAAAIPAAAAPTPAAKPTAVVPVLVGAPAIGSSTGDSMAGSISCLVSSSSSDTTLSPLLRGAAPTVLSLVTSALNTVNMLCRPAHQTGNGLGGHGPRVSVVDGDNDITGEDVALERAVVIDPMNDWPIQRGVNHYSQFALQIKTR